MSITKSDIFCLSRTFTLRTLVRRNLKLKYRKSFLGILWTMLIPAATALVYFFVFQYVMRVEIENYLLFIVTGIIPWTFFQGSIQAGLESIVGNHPILNKVPIVPHIFPLSDTITAFINMLFAIPIIVAVAISSSILPNILWLQLLPLIVFLFIQAYAMALLSSVLFVYLRDLRPIMAIVLQIWFYLTPVIYHSDMIPRQFIWLKYLNPIALIFSGFHKVVVYQTAVAYEEYAVIFVWTCCILFLSLFIYRRNRIFLVERL